MGGPGRAMCFKPSLPSGNGRRRHESRHFGCEYQRTWLSLSTWWDNSRRVHAADVKPVPCDSIGPNPPRERKMCYFTGWSGTGWASYQGKR
eukprot:1005804-Prymnesium_polylepis.1